MPKSKIQIDVYRVEGNVVVCGLYTGERWVRMAMSKADYELLVSDGFFIRDGKTPDSANVINTTNVFAEEG